MLLLPVHTSYHAHAPTPQHRAWTVLAALVLTAPGTAPTPIGIATGTKCAPATRLSPRGDAVHDCHAEALARRAALRWLLHEVRRMRAHTSPRTSPWLVPLPDGRAALHPEARLALYVSTLPCGDASTRTLAAQQDPAAAALMADAAHPTLAPGAAARGRTDYSVLGVLRTKPGRADSPPTRCLSCSDKIARWAVLGIQGALGAPFLAPIYIDRIVIGEVPPELRDIAAEDCARAFGSRLGALNATDLPPGYALHVPEIEFTDVPFEHSRTVLGSSSSSNESFCWIADCDTPSEILINGLRRGVSPKHRYRPKSRPSLSRIALFSLYAELMPDVKLNDTTTYLEVKQRSTDYQAAKRVLIGPEGPFSGWIPTGDEWQQFNIHGDVVAESASATPDSTEDSQSSGNQGENCL